MAATKRYTAEQIVAKLREAERLQGQGATIPQVAKARPQQNGYIEGFNGSMEREVFKHESCHSVLETQVVVNEWRVVYNTRRPHRGLGGMTPAAYAKMAKAQMTEDRSGGGA